MRARAHLHRLLLVSLVVVAAMVVGIVFTVYTQVRSELTVEATRRVEDRMEVLRSGMINRLENLALGMRTLVQAYDRGTIGEREVERSITDFVIENLFVRKAFLSYTDGRLYRSAGTGLEFAEGQIQMVRSAQDGSIDGLVEPFRDAKGWFLGPGIRDEIGLSTHLPVISYEFAGAGAYSAGVVTIDLTELLFSFADELYLVVEGGLAPITVEIFDRSNRLLETTLNNPLFLHPLMERGREVEPDPDGASSISVVVSDDRTGLVLRGVAPTTAVVTRATQLSGRILLIGIVSMLIVLALGVLLLRTAYRLQIAERQRSDVRVRTLQATMHPHFLFNSLDAIVGLVTSDRIDAVLESLQALSVQLHAVVRDKTDAVRVDREITYLEGYLTIQRYRYSDRFRSRLTLGEGTRGLRVPRFCLQPLLENCFEHAIGEVSSTLEIDVDVSLSGADVVVVVSDNGPGCSEEQWRAVVARFESEDDTAVRGVGLVGVHQHLRLCYGPRFGLCRLPAERGFRIQATLPVLDGTDRSLEHGEA